MTTTSKIRPRTRFTLSPEMYAVVPLEARGLARDDVRLLVARPRKIEHASFRDIGDFLKPGDLVVVNTSATLPAAVDGTLAGDPVTVHFSTALDDGTWLVELRKPDSSGPLLQARAGDTVALPGRRAMALLKAHPLEGSSSSRLWRAAVPHEGSMESYLERFGRPITYKYIDQRRPLSDHQSIFAREPGSAEMPSAGRPFTDRLVTDLISRGIVIAPVMLHAGVSSLEADEPPLPERFAVSKATSRLVNETRRAGNRVIAVGTTVTRALETMADERGTIVPGAGWTDTILGPERPPRAVDGLITGWHEPDASHLLLLEAVAGPELVNQAYAAAIDSHYLWHEFGDSCLFLPTPR